MKKDKFKIIFLVFIVNLFLFTSCSDIKSEVNRFLVYILFIIIKSLFYEINFQKNVNEGTALATEPDNRLLLFSTIEGNLVAIEQQTGIVKWKLKDRKLFVIFICNFFTNLFSFYQNQLFKCQLTQKKLLCKSVIFYFYKDVCYCYIF